MLTELEKNIVRVLQEGLPLEPRPLLRIAEKLGMAEEQLIGKINEFMARGIIRRFGATLRHQDIGFVANAMVVWRVPEDRVREMGELLAGFPEVTHCYHRHTPPGWSFNIFTMVHGKTREDCREIARRMSKAAGLEDYEVIFSTRELKKSCMKYFSEPDC